MAASTPPGVRYVPSVQCPHPLLKKLTASTRYTHSNAESGSSGCFKSHNGRRLATTGSDAKLYAGGGECVDHSSVHASHGSGPASLPLKYECTRLYTSTATAIAWINPPTDTIWFQIAHPRSASYV